MPLGFKEWLAKREAFFEAWIIRKTLIFEGKEGKKKGRREGEEGIKKKGWKRKGKKKKTFLARYKPKAKFTRKFYIYPSHVPDSFKVLAATPSF